MINFNYKFKPKLNNNLSLSIKGLVSSKKDYYLSIKREVVAFIPSISLFCL